MFIEKLNRKQSGVYVIEEEKIITNGIWEGYLDHDNVDHRSISIYTGPKLTGEKIENYFVSTPSEMPWKTHLKLFSNSEKVYVVYETTGDQVEADDINLLQDELVNEISRAKDAEEILDKKINTETIRATNAENTIATNLINEITRAKNKETELENKKANTTYVDTELLKKYNKEQVYTKEEVHQKIEDLIGSAPDALDTLVEIADALNNDPNFAATITTELAKKVDKIVGKGLTDENYTLTEKQKLAGVDENANNFVHPANHPANMITESATKRFASDTEKAIWNEKETPSGAQAKANTAESNAKVYTDTHDNNTVKHITSTERTDWNDANSKKHDHSNKTILDKITQVLLDSWNSAVTHITDTIKHITSVERTRWDTVTSKAEKTYVDTTFATKAEIGQAGYGDMLKSVYDTNNDGKVDKAALADAVPWAGVSNKPSTFAPSGHNHSIANITSLQATLDEKETPSGAQAKATAALNSAKSYMDASIFVANADTRAVDSPPSFYGGRRVTYEFKNTSTLGLSSATYAWLSTYNPWSGYLAASHITSQIAIIGTDIYTRQATSTTTWGPWRKLFMQGTALTCNDLKGV